MYYLITNPDGSKDGPFTDEPILTEGQTVSVLSDAEYTAYDSERRAECARKQAAQTAFDSAIAAGFSSHSLGFTIAITDDDRKQFSALEQFLEVSETPDVAPLSVKDIAGNMHEITRAQFRQLFIEAGQYYLSIWTQLQSAK